MVLVFAVVFLLTELLDQLIDFSIGQTLVPIILEPVVCFYDQLKELLWGLQELKLAIVKLLKVLFFQFVQAGLKYILFTGLMAQPHEQKQIVRADVLDHIFFQELQQTLNLKILDNGVVVQYVTSLDLDCNTIKTLEDVFEYVFLKYNTNITS